jgi:mannose/fructose-specific phosphotransferase system component IIA
MAESMVGTAAMLTPDVSQVASVTLWPEDNPDEFQKKLEGKIKEVDAGDGVIILADMLGGTPGNRAVFSLGEKVRMLAGVSLPMLLSLLYARGECTDLAELSRTARDDAGENIVDVNELMEMGEAQ